MAVVFHRMPRRTLGDLGSLRRAISTVAQNRNAREALVPVLLTGYGRGGQRERAALGVPTYGPPITGMDDRAAEFADALECRGEVGDGEVGQGGGVAGARSTLVDSEAQAVGVGLPPGSGRGGPWREGHPEDSVPEPAGAIGIEYLLQHEIARIG